MYHHRVLMPEQSSEVTIILISATAVVLFLASLIILSVFISQKRKFRHRQQMDNLKNQFEKEILKTQLEIQTETFESVSKELHDNVSNTISLALLNLNLLQPGETAEYNKKMEEAKQLLLEAKNSVKDFSWHINPANISQTGLGKSLEELAAKFKNIHTLQLSFKQAGKEFHILPAHHIIIYRIVQEALSNAIKHSRCREIELLLDYSTPVLSIQVKDNGSGFETTGYTEVNRHQKTSGIRNMLSRAKMIEAEIKIESSPGNGTVLTLNCSNSAAP
jgi:signal transduction histidine kinase